MWRLYLLFVELHLQKLLVGLFSHSLNVLLTSVAFGWCLGFTSLVPDFFSLGHEATEVKLHHRKLWFWKLQFLHCYSVSHITQRISWVKKFFLILFMQCSLVFHLFFSFKLFVQKETLLRRLEDNVESEMGNWQKIVERTQRELKEVIIIILSFIHSWNDLPSISFK